jgi:hypothetical protein
MRVGWLSPATIAVTAALAMLGSSATAGTRAPASSGPNLWSDGYAQREGCGPHAFQLEYVGAMNVGDADAGPFAVKVLIDGSLYGVARFTGTLHPDESTSLGPLPPHPPGAGCAPQGVLPAGRPPAGHRVQRERQRL